MPFAGPGKGMGAIDYLLAYKTDGEMKGQKTEVLGFPSCPKLPL